MYPFSTAQPELVLDLTEREELSPALETNGISSIIGPGTNRLVQGTQDLWPLLKSSSHLCLPCSGSATVN